HVATRIRKVFEGPGSQGRRSIGVLRVDQRRLLLDENALARGCDVELELDGLLLPKSSGHSVVPLRFKAVRLGFHRVHAGLELREAKPPGAVRLGGPLEAI